MNRANPANAVRKILVAAAARHCSLPVTLPQPIPCARFRQIAGESTRSSNPCHPRTSLALQYFFIDPIQLDPRCCRMPEQNRIERTTHEPSQIFLPDRKSVV